MKKYKLLKDLPLAKAGAEVYADIDIQKYISIHINNSQNIDDWQRTIAFIDQKDIGEWLEEIPQPKSIWDLQLWDDFYYIFSNSVRKNSLTNYEPFLLYFLGEWNVFLTKEEARAELSKRQAIAQIKRYCFDNNIKVSNKYDSELSMYSFEYTIITDFDGNPIDWFEVDDYGNNASPVWFFEIYADAHKVIENCEKDLRIIFNI